MLTCAVAAEVVHVIIVMQYAFAAGSEAIMLSLTNLCAAITCCYQACQRDRFLIGSGAAPTLHVSIVPVSHTYSGADFPE